MFQSVLFQEPDKAHFVTEHFTTADGLGESLVTDMVRDSIGYLWISHHSGVTRYDGYTFKNYTPGTNSEIKGRYIKNLHIDRNQNLWALSEEGYINKYEFEKQGFTQQSWCPDSLRDEEWFSFIEFAPDTVLLQFINQDQFESLTFLYFKPSEQKFGHHHLKISEKDRHYLDQRIGSDQIDLLFHKTSEDGTEWLGITHILLKKTPKDSIYRVVRIPDQPENFVGLQEIYFEGDSLAWLPTLSRGMILYNRKRNTLTEYRYRSPEKEWVYHYLTEAAINPIKPNEFWLGSKLSSLLKFDTESLNFTQIDDKYNRLSTDIEKPYVDSQGILWIPTKGEGLAKINPVTLQTNRLLTSEIINESESTLDVTQIKKLSDSTIFVSTFENGYYLLDHQGEILFHKNEVAYNQLPHVSVWSGWEGAHRFWLTTSVGLASFDKKYNHRNALFRQYPIEKADTLTGPEKDLMRMVTGDGKDRVWVASRYGLHEFSYQKDRWKTYNYDPADPHSIGEDYIFNLFYDETENRLWIAHSTNGVSVMEWEGREAKVRRFFPENQSSEISRVYNFTKKTDGSMLVAADNGVFLIDSKLEKMVKAEAFSHLENVRVNSLYKDSKGRWWAGTNQGIYISDSEGRVINLDERDGMFNREVMYSFVKTKNDELWVSTYNGILVFDSDSIEIPSAEYDIKVVDFEVLGSKKSINPEQEFGLKYDENNFKLTVSNFDLRDPDSQKWFFRLNGYSDEWLPATEHNIVQFTNLNPGTFDLDVKVESKYGYTQVEPALLHFSIHPAFWQTAWFQFVLFCLVLGVAGGYLYLRYKHTVAVRKERNRIMEDMHDDLSSVLASINFNLNTIEPGQKLSPEKFNLLQKTSDLATETMRDLIWSVNPEKDNWGNFIKACRNYVNDVIGKSQWDIVWEIEGGEEQRIKPNVRKQLFLVFKEIVTNVLKHASAQKMDIILTFNHQIHIQISDNGIGFDTSEKKDGVGLRSVNRRLEELDAKYHVKSSEKIGTHWQIEVPVK